MFACTWIHQGDKLWHELDRETLMEWAGGVGRGGGAHELKARGGGGQVLPAAKQCRRAAPSVKIGRPRRVLTQAQNFPRNGSVERGGGCLRGTKPSEWTWLVLFFFFFKSADGSGAPLHKVATRIFGPSSEAVG